ncbi:MAG: hypothetical protein ACWGQW_11695 [bacterium]
MGKVLKHVVQDLVIGEATGSSADEAAANAIGQAHSNFVGAIAEEYGMSKLQVPEHYSISIEPVALIGTGDEDTGEHEASVFVRGKADLTELN